MKRLFVGVMVLLCSIPAQAQTEPELPQIETVRLAKVVRCEAWESRRCDGEAIASAPPGKQICRARISLDAGTQWINQRASYTGYPANLNYNDPGDAKRFTQVRLVYSGRGSNNDHTKMNFGMILEVIPIKASSEDRFALGCMMPKENQVLFTGRDPR